MQSAIADLHIPLVAELCSSNDAAAELDENADAIMMVRFTAPNVVAMILFIPLLLALGIILAFIVPLLALIVAVASILFLALFTFAKIGLIKKQQVRIGDTNGSSGGHSSEPHKKGKSTLEVRDYKVR